MNDIKIEPVVNLRGMNFFIPSYQRGYRWKKQQVNDLLNDINEFIYAINGQTGEFYCIQPLVVNKRQEKPQEWEVIDGQQRLTIIYILLSYLGENNPYTLQYETRKGDNNKIGSFDFLSNITGEKIKDTKIEDVSKENIDFFYMYRAYQSIVNWFKSNKECEEGKFKDTLLNQVKFIWYESTEEDPIKVFTRLNIGKISLTKAELIKALFLNRSNFSEKEYASIRLKQQEIALEWDKIEYTLQNDEFWLFLNQVGYDKPTRIDMIFNLICEQDRLEMYRKENKKEIDTLNKACDIDNYRTFRYFYQYFKSGSASIKDCWSKVKDVFQILEEWYNDLELYHYVGYLVDQDEKMPELLTLWNDSTSKQDFIEKLKEKIKVKLSNCNDLNKEYETSGNPKTQCKPLLLLHNIQTVINQNHSYAKKDAYKLSTFYKFPFHLYKKENWDVEHIDSNTTNDLTEIKEQKEWLKDMSLDLPNDDDHKSILDSIKGFIQKANKQNNTQDDNFNNICQNLNSLIKNPDFLQEDNNKTKKNEKNLIWNYCLLDSSTNRSYGNAIFSAKRRTIIGKDQGKTSFVDDDLLINEEDGAIAFIPPCTKNVFLKYYNPATNILRAWTKEDAEAYKKNIYNTLKDFGVKMNNEGGNK